MIVFSRRVRSRLKYPTSISTSFGSATAASVETKGRYAHADAGMSRAANSGGRILIGHGLEDEHLRCGPALFLLRRRVHAVGPPVDRPRSEERRVGKECRCRVRGGKWRERATI